MAKGEFGKREHSTGQEKKGRDVTLFEMETIE